MAPLIERTEVDGAAIQELIFNKLGPACAGEPMHNVVLGMLTFAVLLMKPAIELEELKDCVMGASEYLITSLAEPEGVVS